MSDDTIPPSERSEDAATAAMRASLRAYLVLPATQKHLRDVVAEKLGPRATRAVVEDLASEAQTKALEAETLAESLEAQPAWLDGIAHETVAAWRAADREERMAVSGAFVPRGPAGLYVPSDAETKGFLVSKWLRDQAKGNAAELELLDLIAYKARSEKSYDAVAAERGTTPAAIYNRIYRLKQKYEPRWQEHKRNRRSMVILLVAAAVVAVIVALLLLRHRLEARPTDDLPVLRPVPTASATAEEFDNARPTEPSAVPPQEPPFPPKDRPFNPGNPPAPAPVQKPKR